MPVLSSHHQSLSLMEKDNSREDDSLTNLQWLQDFSIRSSDLSSIATSCPPPPHTNQGPCSPTAGDIASCQAPRNGKQRVSLGSNAWPSLPTSAPNPIQEVDYRTNPHVKPPYSYASLICMAMEASQQRKLTLSAIYSWITQNFCYYRHADPSWQNSIRHNLSLNKCFMKVPRGKDEPGKGGFWQMDPRYADMFVNGVLKRRRMPASHLDPPRCNKLPLHHPYQTSSRMNSHQSQRSSYGYKQPRRQEKANPVLPALRVNERHGDNLLPPEDPLNGSNFDDLDLQTALISMWWEGDLGSPGPNASVVTNPGLELAQQDPAIVDSQWFMLPDHHPTWQELKEEPVADQWFNDNGYTEDVLYECPPWEQAETLL
ncbi:PREDICTED: forkhead box protein J1.2-like [Nanorana parkeri]|uniref:forkhead box protein J1.2-like n=1 Tax=Nanorana parkeri TaxID=125878 RepID=UPI000854538F|nr:PREDICTED: forkhead box protein J1.2-like [Nanorana parkeri]